MRYLSVVVPHCSGCKNRGIARYSVRIYILLISDARTGAQATAMNNYRDNPLGSEERQRGRCALRLNSILTA